MSLGQALHRRKLKGQKTYKYASFNQYQGNADIKPPEWLKEVLPPQVFTIELMDSSSTSGCFPRYWLA